MSMFKVQGQRLLLLAVAACQMAAATAAPAGSDGVTAADMVAQRGGVRLTVADVDAKIASMPPEMRADYLNDPERMSRMIDAMLLTKQIAIAAEQARLDDTPEFRRDMELARVEILSRNQIERTIASADLPNLERAAKEKYLGSPDLYRPEPRIDVRHILIPTDGKDEESAKQTALEALQRAQAGEDFVALVNEYAGGDAASPSAGLLERLDPKNLDPVFAKALAQFKAEGEVIGPVRSRFGYHVIKLERYQRFDQPPFDEVKDRIIDALRAEFRAAERTRYLRGFSQLPVELNDAAIQSLPGRYVQTAQAGATPTAPTPSTTASD